MKIGEAGDGLALARVILAMAVGAIVFGIAGTLFDRVVGPMIAMNGWWTVFAAGGLILGGMFQATREWSVPKPAERRAVAERVRAREVAEAADSDDAASASTTETPADASTAAKDEAS